jgi:hypothetical protein
MRVAERLAPLARYEPWIVLAPLVVAQWISVAILALIVEHNGWLYYQGGDQTWFYTSAWEVGNGRVPETLVGYLWPYVLVPLTWLAGPNFLSGLPGIVLLQVVVLLPLGLLCAYAAAARIGGRLLGYLAAVGWIAAPFLVIPLFVGRYHERWTEQTLPQALGLTGLGDFPSMILLMVAAVFVLRVLDGGGRADVLAAGVVTGFAIGVKPANGLFVFAPLVALSLVRRWRAGVEFCVALAPALVTLLLWKYRGTGISVLALDPHVLAAGEPPHPSQLTIWERARKFVPLDVHQINQQFLGFREYFWSARLLEYLPLAGVLGVARRSVPKAAFLAVWLAAFFVVKGSSTAVNVETASFWRLLMPAWPAYFLLVVSLPLLVPVWGPRLAERFPATLRVVRWPRAAIAAVALVLAVPLVATAVLPATTGESSAKLPLQTLFLPIDEDFNLGVTAVEGGLDLRWRDVDPRSASSFFVVYRSPIEYTLNPTDPRVIHQGRLCEPSPGDAPRCTIEMEEVGRTREPRFLDPAPRGTWTYRIGVAANWRDDEGAGDAFVISRPLNVRVG